MMMKWNSSKSSLSRSSGINLEDDNDVILKSAREKSDKKSHHSKKQPCQSNPIVEQWELSSRPKPDPTPGPVIVEVPLVRGTSNGFGFSIAGGVGTEFLENDSGIFITQVTLLNDLMYVTEGNRVS